MRQFFTLRLLVLLGLTLGSGLVWGQNSTNTVKYRVGYEAATQLYTAYLIPDYATPNANNDLANERSSTAQFTLVVPASFSITAITDVAGVWDKNPFKLGPGQPDQNWNGYGLDPSLNYYAIGKTPSETDLGAFVVGQPVALFTFRGNGCFGPLQPLPPGHAFIGAALQVYSFNVANSFYSRSGQPAGGNQDPLEQFISILGPPADCTPPPAVSVVAAADQGTTVAGVGITTPVLANDTNTGSPASVSNVSVSLATAPSVGTAVVNGDGSITYTPPASFTGQVCYTYRICDLVSTTSCSSASVCITVNPRPVSNADLTISKVLVGQKVRTAGEVVTFRVVVRNLGPDGATNVVVKDSLGSGLQYVSSSTSGGSLAWPLLSVGSLASGDSVVVSVQCRVVGEGISFNNGRVVRSDLVDPNGANNVASACVSVPVVVCQGQGVVASVPGGYRNVIWYRNGVQAGTGNSLTFGESGSYTFTATNATCPAEGCCPLVIVSQVCCPVNTCVPFVITKTKKR